jgi:hypothetical protein
MSQVITNKEININQLSYESQIDMNIVSELTGKTIIESSVEQTVLESFVEAHKADNEWVNPMPKVQDDTEEKRIALLARLGITQEEANLLIGGSN